MSKKYISQINNSNFVYPNYKLAEYDIDIIHEIKDNSVTGSTTGFSILYNAGTGNLQLSFTYQWALNSAEPFISNDGKLNILSVHLMTNDKKYFKPWICVGLIQDNNTSLTYKTDTQNFVITPQMVGQVSFTSGTYFAEIRMMGHRAVFALNYSDTVVIATPTPTPTKTGTPTPTPTVTPTGTPGLTTTPTPTPTPTGTPSTLSYSNTRFFFGNTTGDCCIAVASAGFYVPNSGDPILGVPQYIYQNAGGTIPFPYPYVNDVVIGYPSSTYNYNSSTGQVGSYVTSCL
jgi:hypothetical protein